MCTHAVAPVHVTSAAQQVWSFEETKNVKQAFCRAEDNEGERRQLQTLKKGGECVKRAVEEGE